MHTDEVVYSERAVEALTLRLSGNSYSEIGKEMGVSRQRACQLVEQACNRITRHPSVTVEVPQHLQPALPEVMRAFTGKAKRRKNVTARRIKGLLG